MVRLQTKLILNSRSEVEFLSAVAHGGWNLPRAF
jgi:hypothetical protein